MHNKNMEMIVSSLDLDPDFVEFNFSVRIDPTLRTGPTIAHLHELVYQARLGDRTATSEFADTIEWTLREATFESFQRKHGPRPISYRDWFYCKLAQFVSILLYKEISTDCIRNGKFCKPETDRPWEEGFTILGGSGPGFSPVEFLPWLTPADAERVDWYELTRLVSAQQPDRRLDEVESWFVAIGKPQPSPRSSAGRARRDALIRQGLTANKSRREICGVLDANAVATTPQMKANGITLWIAAWDDQQFRKNVQQVISKASIREPVK
jgi:hypothetical protein